MTKSYKRLDKNQAAVLLVDRRAKRHRCLLNQMPATKRNTDAAGGKSRGTRSRYVKTSKVACVPKIKIYYGLDCQQL